MFKDLMANLGIVVGRGDGKRPPPLVKAWVSIIITFLVLGVGLYVILSPGYDDSVKKWAFGVVGAIIGFWFKD